MKRRFTLSPGAVLILSLVYFFGGISALLAVLLSAAVHELGHVSAIKALGGKVKRLSFDSSGLSMCGTGTYSAAGEIGILLSGPSAGLALAYICSHIGALSANELLLKTAGMSLVLSVYNLLPALPLDGGRALLAFLRCFTDAEKAERTMYFISLLTALALAVPGVYARDRQMGLALLAASAWLLIAQTGIVKSMRLM